MQYNVAVRYAGSDWSLFPLAWLSLGLCMSLAIVGCGEVAMKPISTRIEARARLAAPGCCARLARLGLGYRIKHVQLDADGPSRISTEYTGEVPNANLSITQRRFADPANDQHQKDVDRNRQPVGYVTVTYTPRR